jgi:HEAT repeat protein
VRQEAARALGRFETLPGAAVEALAAAADDPVEAVRFQASRALKRRQP